MYDVAILGGGIAGCSAAIYTSFGQLSTIVFDTNQSQITSVSSIKNYPGIEEVSGDQLLQTIKKQAISFGAEWKEEQVIRIEPMEEGYFLTTEKGERITAKYVIMATNLQVKLLEELGFQLDVNAKVPSGKIKRATGVTWEGVTSLKNLYIAGLLAGLPSQSVVAAGQGASVGIDIVSKEKGSSFIWHDV